MMSLISLSHLILLVVLIGLVFWGVRIVRNLGGTEVRDGGVRGWLMLLTVGLLVIGPLFRVGTLNADLLEAEHANPAIINVPAWSTYTTVAWISCLATTALSMYAGFSLAKFRNPLVVKQCITVLWIIGPLAAIIDGYFIPAALFPNITLSSELIGNMITPFITAGIWTAYLLLSKRVKATYYPASYT